MKYYYELRKNKNNNTHNFATILQNIDSKIEHSKLPSAVRLCPYYGMYKL